MLCVYIHLKSEGNQKGSDCFPLFRVSTLSYLTGPRECVAWPFIMENGSTIIAQSHSITTP